MRATGEEGCKKKWGVEKDDWASGKKRSLLQDEGIVKIACQESAILARGNSGQAHGGITGELSNIKDNGQKGAI